ncbi:hypothetical protein ACFJIY_07685 [Pimelobacter simplex]|uniref:hypothetical protein n=1 Tax=Nocardioides simplex TaxID=2045 RepID=UPI00367253BA
MSELVPEAIEGPVVALLKARRAELTGGPDSVGVQEQRVAEMQADVDAACERLAACVSEVEAIDAALALLETGGAA